MLVFSKVFQTRQQALDFYKSQLSGQKIFVESFESYAQGTSAKVVLEILETKQKIELNATVDSPVGRNAAIERHLGQRAGLFLNVPIQPDMIAPLRSFFTIGNQNNNRADGTATPSRSAAESPATAPSGQNQKIIRPAGKTNRIPFDNIQSMSPDSVMAETDRFIRNAKDSSLYRLFNVLPTVTRPELRSIYNTIVAVLHPDRHPASFSPELCQKLSSAYQIFNDAYQILQNTVERSVYMDVSRDMGKPSGMSLDAYRKWKNDYQIQNGNNIRMAEELVQNASDAQRRGDAQEQAQMLQLALKYDPYCQAARSKLKN